MALRDAAMGCACLLAAAAVSAAPAVGAGPPSPGRYAARMCVQPLAQPVQPANCGPAEAVVRPGKAQLRISDLVYRLELNSSQVDVVLMHGTMLIDEFSAFYEWQGATLQFSDREKGMRYEVRFGAPERPAR